MKYIRNITRFLLLCLIIPFTVSCVDLDENPLSGIPPENFYKTESELNAALTGIIKAIYSDWSGFDSGYDLILASGAEDVASYAGIYKNFDGLTPTDSELVIKSFWRKAYEAISNANTLIYKLPYAENIPEETIDHIEGQARFLRAFTYFYLVRFFGPIQVTSYESQENIEKVKQSSVAEVYDAIIEDLSIAEQKLPVSFEAKGRPTKGAAKILLAKAYLTMTGWPVNDKLKYALARDKAAEVMNSESGYDLEENYADLWKQSHKLTSKEFIFTFYGSIDGGDIGASHMLESTMYYDFGEKGWGDYFSETRFYNAFPDGPRKDATFTSVFADGTTFIQAGVEPYIAKYRDAGKRSYTGNEGFRPILRFADALLIYAEAANYVNNGPTDAALEALNRIRRRAQLPIYPANMTQREFDKAVLDERAWEFACEGDRWHDLVRKELVVEANISRFPAVKVTARLLPKPGTELIPGILDQNEY